MMSAMDFRHELTYDAPPDEVFAMLADPAFREDVCEFQKVLRATATVEADGGTTTVVVDQVQPADGIPSFAKKFVGEEIHIVQREDWSSPTAADLQVTIPGKPGEMAGTIRLTDSGGTTTETVEVSIRVRIPLVGGRIEGLIADLLRKALRAEEKVGNAYLSR